MLRIGLLLALFLTLATGLVIGQMRILGNLQPSAVPAREAKTVEHSLVLAFYDALNTAIEFGDASGIHQVTTPSFVNNFAFSRAGDSADSLERYLLALHRQAPDALLRVAEVASEGTLVAVRLDLRSETPLTVSGLHVDLFEGEGYELLRFEGSKVAERWASPALPPLIEHVGSLEIATSTSWAQEPRLERVTLEPRANLQIEEHGGTVLLVNSGTLLLTTDSPLADAASPSSGDRLATGRNDVRSLGPGDSASIPGGTEYRLSTATNESAELTWVRILQVRSPELASAGATKPHPGVDITLLAGGSITGAGDGALSLVVERIHAGRGTLIDTHAVGQIELAYVEAGGIEVDIQDGFAFQVTTSGTFSTHNKPFTLGAGQAFSIPKRAKLGYQVSGDQTAAMWIVTIEPVKYQQVPGKD